MKSKTQLFFFDTNIYLNLYHEEFTVKTRNEFLSGLRVIEDTIIFSEQVYAEFLKNRGSKIAKAYQDVKSIKDNINALPKISDKNKKSIIQKLDKSLSELQKHAQAPQKNDDLFKFMNSLLKKGNGLILTEHESKYESITTTAQNWYFKGFPPRKDKSIHIGDIINYLWIKECAKFRNADINLITNDGDFFYKINGKPYINDYLKYDFEKYTSNKIHLYHKVQNALNENQISVSEDAKLAENKSINFFGTPAFLVSPRSLKPHRSTDNLLVCDSCGEEGPEEYMYFEPDWTDDGQGFVMCEYCHGKFNSD